MYFVLANEARYIIAFDILKKYLTYVECPTEMQDIFMRNLHIIKGHNGGVGLAVVRNLNLQIWSSEISLKCAHAWKLHRVVNLATVLGIDTTFPYYGKCAVRLLCAFEDRDVVFVSAKEGIFQLYFSNLQWSKFNAANIHCTLYPFSMIPG